LWGFPTVSSPVTSENMRPIRAVRCQEISNPASAVHADPVLSDLNDM
jgi:hypothetical protein